MPIYRYVARNRKGKQEKGIIDSRSPASARQALRSKGLYLQTLTEDSEKKDRELFPALSGLLYRVPRRDVSLFARQLGTLLEAGLPLDRSLDNIIEQTGNQHLKKAIIEVKSSVIEGETLSNALKKQSAIFPAVYHNLVRVGEETGTYEKSLVRLSDLEDAGIALRGKIQSAMTYPIFMLVLMGAIMLFLLGVVFPQIEQMFAQMDAELPFITQIVMGISSIVTSWKIIIPATILGAGYYLFYDWKKTEKGTLAYEKFLLKQPLIGGFIQKTLQARFARNLGVMLENQVSLITSLQVTANVVSHLTFQKEILTAMDRIKEGSKISDAFRDSTVISKMLLGMISAGEISDRVPEMVTRSAQIMETDLDATIQKFTALMEPVMMVVMGGMIALVMIAILLPIYDLTNQF